MSLIMQSKTKFSGFIKPMDLIPFNTSWAYIYIYILIYCLIGFIAKFWDIYHDILRTAFLSKTANDCSHMLENWFRTCSLLCNFIEITLRHGFSPVNLLHIFRTPFPENTSGWLLLHFPYPLKTSENHFDLVFWFFHGV